MPLAMPSTYRGGVVIPYAPNADVDRAHVLDEPASTLETVSGLTAISPTQTTDPQGSETWTVTYTGLTRAQARTLEQFVEDRAGRKSGFWCSTFQHEFRTLPHSASYPEGTVYVRDWGYASSISSLGLAYQHILFVRGSRVLLAPVTTIHSNGSTAPDGTPVLGYVLNTGAGDVLAVSANGSAAYSDIGLSMARLLWVRCADDALTTEWAHPHLATLAIRVVAIPAESP